MSVHKCKQNDYLSDMIDGVNSQSTISMPEYLTAAFHDGISKAETLFESHTLKGYLNYRFAMYKICELLGEYEFMDRFHLLKSHDKLLMQDDNWRSICDTFNWQYIPTFM
jgi:hypothetical protein